MEHSDDQQGDERPTEQRGGATPSEQEAREKGPWAAKAREGVVPAELGGSDAPSDLLDDDPELGHQVLGAPAHTDEPATETGVDLDAGDNADATSDGGPRVPEGVEPDLKDASTGPRQTDIESQR